MPVLDERPLSDMSDANVLTIAGETDDYGRYAEALGTELAAAGAHVEQHVVPHGHELTDDDVPIIQAWLASSS
jgi:phospholipase/carboxylesterase